MRALVLAGGEGSPLRPLSHPQAKQRILMARRSILVHTLAGGGGAHREVAGDQSRVEVD